MRKGFLWLLLIFVVLISAGCGESSATGSSSQDPILPHVTREDRGWVDPTSSVSTTTLDALRNVSDVIESEGFQLSGVFFSDCSSDPSKVASDFGNENGIGSQAKDNGLVVLVLLDRAGTDGHKPYIFVAAGKGLEGLLNDAKITRFRETYFNPLRAQDKWEEGLIQLTTKFAEYLRSPSADEFSDSTLGSYAQAQNQVPVGTWLLIIIFVLVVVGLIAFVAVKSGYTGGGSSSSYYSSSDDSSSSSSSYGGGGSFGGGGSGG